MVLAAAIAIGIFLATQDDEGAQQATVPDVVGFTQDAAVNAVSDAGFSPQTKEGASDKVAEGLVISTTPPGGEQADTGSRVTITVSQGNGNVSVPTVIGVTQDEAVAVLQQAGLKSRVIEQPSANAPEGVVISQQPTGDSRSRRARRSPSPSRPPPRRPRPTRRPRRRPRSPSRT